MSNTGDYVRNDIYDPHRLGMSSSPNVSRKRILVRLYERVLTEMAMNRFTWEGMPDTVDTRFLEYTLFNNALSVFYFDTEYDRYMALRGTGAGRINMYDNPTVFRVYGNAMLNKSLAANECVPIWSNYLRHPDWDIVRIYSQRLAEADRTVEINMLAERHPFVFAVSNDERLTMQNAFRQVQEGMPVIWGTDAMSVTSLQDKVHLFDLTTDKDRVVNDMTVKTRIWNEALTLLGIMNVNSEKRERMVVEEASGASGQVMAMRAIALNSRAAACEQINKMYGLDVSVKWNLDESVTAGVPGLEGNGNGDIHDGIA